MFELLIDWFIYLFIYAFIRFMSVLYSYALVTLLKTNWQILLEFVLTVHAYVLNLLALKKYNK